MILPECLTIEINVERLFEVVHIDLERRQHVAEDVQGNRHENGKEEHHLSEGPVKVPGQTLAFLSFLVADCLV